MKVNKLHHRIFPPPLSLRKKKSENGGGEIMVDSTVANPIMKHEPSYNSRQFV
jgi:hypothetical protein